MKSALQASSVFPCEHLPIQSPTDFRPRNHLAQPIQAYSEQSCDSPVGVIVCKQSMHKHTANRGYIAMLSVSKKWRKRGIGKCSVCASRSATRMNIKSIYSQRPREEFCQCYEGTWCRGGVSRPPLLRLRYHFVSALTSSIFPKIVLETEFDNHAALSLYESLGFIREKRLYRFYLNGKDAFRLVLAIPPLSDDEGSEGSSPTSITTPSRPPYRAIRVSPHSDEDDDEVSSR